MSTRVSSMYMYVFPLQLDFGGTVTHARFIIEKITGTNLFIGIKVKGKMANDCRCPGWVSHFCTNIANRQINSKTEQQINATNNIHSTKKASNHHANLPLEMYSFTL